MLSDWVKKIVEKERKLRTYEIGLLQSKASRILRARTMVFLKPQGIAEIDWSLLGLLCQTKNGMRLVDAADILGVDPPFVTIIVNKLVKKAFLRRKNDATDRRAKRILLTENGRAFVNDMEKEIRAGMRPLLTGINAESFLGYLQVLEIILKNEDVSFQRENPSQSILRGQELTA